MKVTKTLHLLIARVTSRLPLCLITTRMRRLCAKPTALLLSSTHRAQSLVLLLLAIIRLRTGHRRRLIWCLALRRRRCSILLMLVLQGLVLLLLVLVRHRVVTWRRLLLLSLNRASTHGYGTVIMGSIAILEIRRRSCLAVQSCSTVSVHGDRMDRKRDDEEDATEIENVSPEGVRARYC